MKLLYILPEYPPHTGGGIITFYRTLLPQLEALGHEVKVVVGSGVCALPTTPAVRLDGVTVETLDVALMERQLPRFARYAATPGLRRYLAAAWALHEQARGGEDFDVVEATDWGLLFLPWAVEAGPPVVAQMHGSCGQIDVHDPVAGEELQGQLLRLLEMNGAARADAVQSYSEANAAFWRAQAGRAVDMISPAWRPAAVAPQGAPRSGQGLVVGRVQRWKGPEVLCQALRRLGPGVPRIEWVGRDTSFERRGRSTGGHLAEAYPDVWNKGLAHRPQLPPEQTAELQARASFVVVPSSWDMFNFTAVEAMGVGTPVICSTGAGASHLIQDGTNGLLFEREDPESLAAALDRLLAMPEAQREAMGAAGRSTILAALDPARIAEQRLRAYTAVAASRRRTTAQDDWLRLACSPGALPGGELDFLDHLPLKALSRYVGRRGLARLLP